MSAPIDFDDIQLDDTVKCEWSSSHCVTGVVAAIENDAAYSRHRRNSYLIGADSDKFTLINRPTPAVKMPSEPTLGWATVHPSHWAKPITVLAEFTHTNEILKASIAPRYIAHDVTAFVAATAVPTDTLDRLRAVPRCGKDIRTFLDAVDAANGPTA